MMKNAWLDKGILVDFKYEGGENPGQVRTVLVLENVRSGQTSFQGYCFTRKSVRTFSLSKIDRFSHTHSSRYLTTRLSTLPKSLQDGKSVAAGYEAEGKSTIVFGDFVYAVNPPVPTSKVVCMWSNIWNCNVLDVTGRNGKHAIINICGQTNAELIKQLTAIEL